MKKYMQQQDINAEEAAEEAELWLLVVIHLTCISTE